MLNLCFLTRKRHSLRGNTSFDVFLSENRFRSLGCKPLEVAYPRKRSGVNIFDAQFRAYGEKKPPKES